MSGEEVVVRSALAREKVAIARALVAGVVVSLSTVSLAGTSAWLIVRAAQRPSVLSLSVPMGLVQLFALAKAAGRYVERLHTHRAALRVMGHVRARVAGLLEPLLPAGLGPRSADVVDLALRDVDRVQDLLTAVAGPLLASTVAGLVTVLISGLLVPWTALSLLVALAINAFALPALAAWWGSRSDGEVDSVRSQMVGLFDDAAQSGDEYVMAGMAGELNARLSHLEDRLDVAQRQRHAMSGAVSALAVVTSGAAAMMAVALSAQALRSGRLVPALIAVPVLLGIAVMELVGGVAPALVGVRGDRAALARLAELSRRTSPVHEPVIPGPAISDGAVFAARDTSFSYGDGEVLRRISMTMAPGEAVILSGSSGEGKTTLARLLVKFLEPTAGRLEAGATDYRNLQSSQVREHVGFVDDEPYIFATSLAGNLRIARPDASDAELRDVCNAVGLGALLSTLPEGLATRLGGPERGLSGGEQRRIGVARELLVHRGLVILDEPTEGLDEEAAAVVLDAIFDRYREQSVLIITHREVDHARATSHLQLLNGSLNDITPTLAISTS